MVQLDLISDVGQGQPIILLTEAEHTKDAIIPKEVTSHRIIHFQTPRVKSEGWLGLSNSLLQYMDQQGIKQASFVGFGDSAAVVQHVALSALKRVRRIILVNARTRPHPTRFDKITDWIESKLPLGLPLRSVGNSFNSKPFLHRLRCPCLIVLTANASSEYVEQAALFNDYLPTAWFRLLEANEESKQLADLIVEFQNIPAKRPQKNL